MKIAVGTLNSKIITDNPDLLSALVKLYSFKSPGYQYSSAYKSRRWDGTIRFISKNGTFRSGLLESLLKDLEKIECMPELEYTHDRPPLPKNDWEIPPFTYYDFQKKLIAKGLDKKRGIIKSPTGSGKTLIMAGLIKALEGRKMVLLFNAKQLLTQTYEFLTTTCEFKNIGLCYGEGYIYGDTMLCTVQSIEKILDTHLNQAEVLMVDECHEFSNGKTTLAAIRAFPNAQYRFGFTATPPSESIPKYNLEGSLGTVWEIIDTSGLVKEGKLTKPIINLVRRKYAASGGDESMGYSEVYENYITHNHSRNTKITEIVHDIKKQNQRPRILILTKSLDHGRSLEKLLRGESCQFLEGANSLGERYSAISKFRNYNGPSILIGTKILQTGINIEEITHLINARGMKSEIATLQALGRALRKHKSKQEVLIYDFLDQEKYLKQHSLERKKYYENQGHKVIVL
jgi:superfamily II DNA or RNA helicase